MDIRGGSATPKAQTKKKKKKKKSLARRGGPTTLTGLEPPQTSSVTPYGLPATPFFFSNFNYYLFILLRE
jgi:hypothetical protein